MNRPIPPELERLTRLLPGEWTRTSLSFWSMGWVEEFRVRGRCFRLVADRGYIDVFELVDGVPQPVPPPEDQRASISAEQVCNLLVQAAA